MVRSVLGLAGRVSTSDTHRSDSSLRTKIGRFIMRRSIYFELAVSIILMVAVVTLTSLSSEAGVVCNDDSDCFFPTPVCDVSTNTCVECAFDSDCLPPTPVCDAGTSTCVECLVAGDCAE